MRKANFDPRNSVELGFKQKLVRKQQSTRPEQMNRQQAMAATTTACETGAGRLEKLPVARDTHETRQGFLFNVEK